MGDGERGAAVSRESIVATCDPGCGQGRGRRRYGLATFMSAPFEASTSPRSVQ